MNTSPQAGTEPIRLTRARWPSELAQLMSRELISETLCGVLCNTIILMHGGRRLPLFIDQKRIEEAKEVLRYGVSIGNTSFDAMIHEPSDGSEKYRLVLVLKLPPGELRHLKQS